MWHNFSKTAVCLLLITGLAGCFPKKDSSGDKPAETKAESSEQNSSAETVATEAVAVTPETFAHFPEGYKPVMKATAKTAANNGYVSISDEDAEKGQLVKWVVKKVPANTAHTIAVDFAKTTEKTPWSRVQVLYKGADKTSSVYICQFHAKSGKTKGLKKATNDDVSIADKGADWAMTCKTAGHASEGSMIVTFLPAIGKGKTGALQVKSLTVSK